MRTAGRLIVMVVVSSMLLTVGCADESAALNGRFLTSYAGIARTPESGDWYVWFNRRPTIHDYTEFTISPLIIQLPRNQPTPVSMADVNKAEEAYRQALIKALTHDGRFKFVERPGDGVLRLRGFISDLYQRDPRRTVGRVTMELEGMDAVTRQRIFAAIDPMVGQVDGEQHPDPKKAFTEFADELRRQIDRMDHPPAHHHH